MKYESNGTLSLSFAFAPGDPDSPILKFLSEESLGMFN